MYLQHVEEEVWVVGLHQLFEGLTQHGQAVPVPPNPTTSVVTVASQRRPLPRAKHATAATAAAAATAVPVCRRGTSAMVVKAVWRRTA